MSKTKIICIGGPTATGKSGLAIRIAKKFNGEIISADCTQVYKHLNIGTAKITSDEMQGIRHHLLDFLDPKESFSVVDFKNAAEKLIDKIKSRNKVPIIVGGTGFYIKSLLFPYSFGNTSEDRNIRTKYEDILKSKGKEYLFKKLESVDPQSAVSLHPNDSRRVIRALEIYEITGIKKSDQKISFVSPYDYLMIGVYENREILYQRINQRVEKMVHLGLIDEFRMLTKNKKLNRKHQSMGAIGYKELFDHMNGDATTTECIGNIKRNTRRYAKRQFTWFKRMPNIKWFKVNDLDEITINIRQWLKKS